MKMHWLIPCGLLLLGSNVLGQLTPAAPTQTTTSGTNLSQLIINQDKKAQMERWKILQETQTKIFEIQQDVTVNRAKTVDRSFQMFDQYIRDGAPPAVKSPSIQSSGRITVTPASGGTPAPGEVPIVTFTMKVLLSIIGQSPLNAGTPLWQSDPLTTTANGFGTFDYNLSFSDPALSLMLSDTDILSVETDFTATYDTTSVASDDVRVVIGTGLDPYPDLPETGLSFLNVPEPAHLAVLGMTWILAQRRGRVI